MTDAKRIAELERQLAEWEVMAEQKWIDAGLTKLRDERNAARDDLSAANRRAEGLQEHANVWAAINRACGYLPDDYEVHIELERGAGTIRLYDPEGNENSDFDHDTFAARINAAIDAALAAHREPAQKSRCPACGSPVKTTRLRIFTPDLNCYAYECVDTWHDENAQKAGETNATGQIEGTLSKGLSDAGCNAPADSAISSDRPTAFVAPTEPAPDGMPPYPPLNTWFSASGIGYETIRADDYDTLAAYCQLLARRLQIAELKNKSSLANNLCPDHRDKQAGKSCLACAIESAEHELAELRKSDRRKGTASKSLWDRRERRQAELRGKG